MATFDVRYEQTLVTLLNYKKNINNLFSFFIFCLEREKKMKKVSKISIRKPCFSYISLIILFIFYLFSRTKHSNKRMKCSRSCQGFKGRGCEGFFRKFFLSFYYSIRSTVFQTGSNANSCARVFLKVKIF